MVGAECWSAASGTKMKALFRGFNFRTNGRGGAQASPEHHLARSPRGEKRLYSEDKNARATARWTVPG